MTVELQDVLDKNGEKTGRQASKDELFRNGDWRSVVHVCIVNAKSELLVQRRAPDKRIFDSLRDVSVGGGVIAGEDPIDAAIREVHEELGVKLPKENLLHIGRFKIPKFIPEREQQMNEFSDAYVAYEDVQIDDLSLQAEEVFGASYMPLDVFLRESTSASTACMWVPHGALFYTALHTKITENSPW